MKAIQITEFGGPEVMKFIDIADPVAGVGTEVLDVSAIGINYADTHQTENSYLSEQKLPLIPGMEVVGTLPDGRRVLALAPFGGYCQKTLVDPKQVISLPNAISDAQALSMMVQGLTAYHLLKTLGGLQPGQSVVVHAAAGGVGTIAIQLAKLWGGFVIAVTSSEEKKNLALQLGADVVVDAKESDLKSAIKAANGGKSVDLVLEMVGGTTFDQSLEALGTFGKIITYGMASRQSPKMIHPSQLMARSQSVSGFWLANCFGKPELVNKVLVELFDLIESGKLKPVIGATFPLSQAVKAHQSMLARESVGKIVLDPKG